MSEFTNKVKSAASKALSFLKSKSNTYLVTAIVAVVSFVAGAIVF